MTTQIAKPFIKWAGGKTQLLQEIEQRLPNIFHTGAPLTYVEPFVGGGAALFYLLQTYHSIEKAIINDINPKLITLYREIKAHPDALIGELATLEAAYLPKSHEERSAFYLDRRQEFNADDNSPMRTSALFIFLNRTCFNGLYRENAKGAFNVPHGRYANPTICDAENIMAVHKLLQRVSILQGDFQQTADYASKKTFYYLDPPYKPLSETSSFNSYVKVPFDDSEQVRLKHFIDDITKKGAHFILSNSDTKAVNPDNSFFDLLYKEYDIQRVMAARMVNSKGDRRGKLSELMISNARQQL